MPKSSSISLIILPLVSASRMASNLNSRLYSRRLLLITRPPFWFIDSLLSFLPVYQNGVTSDVLLLRRDQDAQLGGFDHSFLERLFADGAGLIDQQVATLALEFVTGQVGSPQEPGGVFPPGFYRAKESLPVVVDLDQDLIGDFAG